MRSTSFTAAHLKSHFKQNVTTLCGSVCTCTALHVQLFIYLLALFSGTSMSRERGKRGGGGGGEWETKERLHEKAGFGRTAVTLTWCNLDGELQFSLFFGREGKKRRAMVGISQPAQCISTLALGRHWEEEPSPASSGCCLIRRYCYVIRLNISSWETLVFISILLSLHAFIHYQWPDIIGQ